MARHFTGTHTHKLDSKGRVSLPSPFRRVLEAQGGSDTLYLLPNTANEPAHTVYSQAGYDRVMDAFYEQFPEDHPQHAAAAERYVTNVEAIPVDSAGRFVISRDLRNAIGLEEEVSFVGFGNRFQLWEPGARSRARAAARDTSAEPPSIRIGKI